MRYVVLLSAALSVMATPLAAQTHLVIISGLGGEPRYSQTFSEWATALRQAAVERFGIPESQVVSLAERANGVSGRSTKDNIERALRDLAERSRPTDQVFVIIIGHGSSAGGQATINLPGPDMSAFAFGELLALFPSQKIAFVNTASASGEFIQALSGRNRTIITATRSSTERHETIFGGFFVRAFSEDVADLDKDEQISLLEAFTYAKREVERTYETEKRLLTEHALLDDNGDGEGSLDPDPQTSDGALARTMFMTSGEASVPTSDDPRLAELYRQRAQLESEVVQLRATKDQMDQQEYETDLERLLLELARTSRAIRDIESEGR